MPSCSSINKSRWPERPIRCVIEPCVRADAGSRPMQCLSRRAEQLMYNPKPRAGDAMKALPPGAASTRSVWTVDLAYGLKNRGFRNFFCTTINNCVDPSHAELGFYSSGFSDDERRVNQLITTAAQNGVVIYEESVSEEDLGRFLAVPGNIVIALVNSTDMECEVPSPSSISRGRRVNGPDYACYHCV